MPVWPGGHGSNKLHEVLGVIGQVFSLWNSSGPFLVSFAQFWSKKIFGKKPAGRTDRQTDTGQNQTPGVSTKQVCYNPNPNASVAGGPWE